MTLKGDAKSKGKLTRDLKNDISIWLILSKAYKVLDEKVQKSYIS